VECSSCSICSGVYCTCLESAGDGQTFLNDKEKEKKKSREKRLCCVLYWISIRCCYQEPYCCQLSHLRNPFMRIWHSLVTPSPMVPKKGNTAPGIPCVLRGSSSFCAAGWSARMSLLQYSQDADSLDEAFNLTAQYEYVVGEPTKVQWQEEVNTNHSKG
jgi:hypothetical protein